MNMADYSGSISFSQARNFSNSSDDDEDNLTPRTDGAGSSRPEITATNNTAVSGGCDITIRKPRGRPPGSKNKPKPPIVVTKENESAMKPMVLEISPGSDIIDMVIQFARRRRVGFSIFSGSGTVSNVTLHHPGSRAPSLTLHGPFNILSLTGTFLGYSSSHLSSCCFGISLAGAQGRVYGGIIAGKVMAASQVVVVGSTFMNPTVHKVPVEFEEQQMEDNQAQANNSGGGSSESRSSAEMPMSRFGVAAGPVPLNSFHHQHVSSSDHHALAWGPTSRPPPPY